MKYFAWMPFAVLIGLSAQAQNPSPDAPVGLWTSPDQQVVLKIDQLGDQFQGRIAWVAGEEESGAKPQLDSRNPDARMRVMPLKGRKILEGLRFDAAEGRWTGGTFYDHTDGKTYECALRMVDPRRMELEKTGPGSSRSVWTRKQ